MDLAAILPEPVDVALVHQLAKVHYVAEQSLRNVHNAAKNKNTSRCLDLPGKWEVEQHEVQAAYSERALELVSSDQYKGAQVNDFEFAQTLYAKLYAELDSNPAAAAFPIQLSTFTSAVKVLLSPETRSGLRSVQAEEEGTAVAVVSPPAVDAAMVDATDAVASEEEVYSIGNTADQRIEALESAVTKGVKVLTEMRELFSESDDWVTETDWRAEIEKTLSKARKEKVVIGIVGSTGAGKSSLINVDEKGVLTTDCMRASTAVPIEVSYNDGESCYKAEVQFISHRAWERELRILFAELCDHAELLARGEAPRDPEAAIALDKIMAVYPALKRPTLLESSPDDLMNDKRVSDLLGRTIRIEENHSKSFSEGLKAYIDSKGKKRSRPKSTAKKTPASQPSDDRGLADQGIGLWPLVRVVRVFVKAEALSTGAVLVDLPGVFDSNAARVAVADEYMKRCSAHWIVAPINRAVDDKVAHDLLGKNFQTQMHMDGAFNDITFICTKTDDIVPAEVARSLDIELPSIDDDRGAYLERLEGLETELQVHRESQEQISSKLDAVQDEIDELEEKEGDLDGVVLTPKKRKRIRMGEESPGELISTMTLSEDVEDADEDDDRPKSWRKLHGLRAQRKELDDQRRQIQQQIVNTKNEIKRLSVENQNIEFNDLRFCIEARNNFSKHEIKRDFAQTIANLDLEDENADDAMPLTPRRDYSELERNLAVFCVSPRAYHGLRGRSEPDIRVGGFSHLEQTEIPALQRYCISLTSKARERAARQFLVALNSLLQSMTLWSSIITQVAGISDQTKLEIEAGFHSALNKLAEAVNKSRDLCISDGRRIIKNKITKLLGHASRFGNGQYPDKVASWNASCRQGGLRFNTYQANCRRQGVFRELNMNHEIALPMITKTKPGWRNAFLELLPDAYQQLGEELREAFGGFHSEAIQSVKWELPQAISKQLQDRLVAFHESMREQVQHLHDWTKQEQRKASSQFSESIATGLQETYEACAQLKGIGTLQAVRALMSEYAEKKGSQVFRKAAVEVQQSLEAWLCALKKKIEQIVEGQLQEIGRDYHQALIAPYLRHYSDAQARCKAQARCLIRDVQADLQLGVLLGSGGLPQTEQAPVVDKQKATGTTESAANS
ncbi:hypothetical protein BO82DRAFT_432039 [Aspergillus uvarum CBS 121591]|uniref:Tat pathway signal sequence n=1 Tax=Aspergillus uvarum CBS 121591 TaxID=1448315 RepID=A0A319D2Q0_9EURO|nr:hypothetical protein BO82DRAFT_432039 [Aspergillus uvarum CBS 121591]PYH82208.1 hypothetical protein BO82DRAFT_432039 [Aspergillus uvarum CBS 121591]